MESGMARGLEPAALFDALTIEDIQMACDRLRGVFAATGGLDGRASIEGNPNLAGDTAATIDEGRRLHRALQRSDVMVEGPATAAGVPPITAPIADGLFVDGNPLFSPARHSP